MYLFNAWYCAGFGSEIGRQPIGRRYLDKPVVLYRTEAGEAVALQGYCPHRFAPLHRGLLIGDVIECPYHGLLFGASGHCVGNPNGGGDIPKDSSLTSYPLVERDGLVWIWMGDPALADPATIIPTDFAGSEDYTLVKGYLSVDAHYQLVIDNLLDLTHPAVLHRGGLSSEEYSGDKMERRFRQDGLNIHSDYIFRNVNASPQLAHLWGDRKSDVRVLMTLFSPANLFLDFRMNEVDGPIDEGLMLPTLHLIVPESELKTHYFYVMGRNVELENQELTAFVEELTRRAFVEEDEPMIQGCQEMMGTTDLFSLKPLMLKTDVAGVRARLLLTKLIDKEQGRRSDETLDDLPVDDVAAAI